MLFATDMRGLTVFGSLLGAGIGLFLTSNWALANSLAPEGEAGKYLGLTNLATAGSGGATGTIGSGVSGAGAGVSGSGAGARGFAGFTRRFSGWPM